MINAENLCSLLIALSLSRTLEMALDSGKFVLVPVPGEKNAWKCVVTMTGELNKLATNGFTWNV